MIPCPDPGRWRAYLDGAVVPAERARLAAHLAGCPACQTSLEELRQAADFARARLAGRAPGPSPAATRLAWQRLLAQLDQPQPSLSVTWYERIRAMFTRFSSRAARLAVSSALAGLAVMLTLALTPAGSQALQALSVFRVQTFKAITIEVDPATLQQTAQRRAPEKQGQAPDPLQMRQEIERELAAAGVKLDTTVSDKTMREVDTLAAARAAAPSGTTVRTITPPAPLRAGQPKVYVADPARTVLSVDLTKLRQAMRDNAKSLPEGAPAIDLTTLPGINPNVTSLSATLQTAFAVVQSHGEGEQSLVFAQSASPVLTLSEGIDILAIRDALLAAPGISKTTRTQLLSIRDDEWTKTLIIPVPTGTIVKDIRVGGLLGVGGEAGLLILDPQGKGGAVLWQQQGILYAVAGSFGEADLVAAANSAK